MQLFRRFKLCSFSVPEDSMHNTHNRQTRLTDFSDCRTAADMELASIGTLKTLLSEVLPVPFSLHICYPIHTVDNWQATFQASVGESFEISFFLLEYEQFTGTLNCCHMLSCKLLCCLTAHCTANKLSEVWTCSKGNP